MFESIALLCQVVLFSPTPAQILATQVAQTECQKRLIECVENAPQKYERWQVKLAACVKSD